ncbi:GAF domain-containing protein [Streptomyces sp. NPDC001508]|uniref:GAF domain-containing protein n=1 Tax=Streptomyces sp. NPDC001508 TaxID=3154656 RepID=UPI003332D78C
MTVSYRATSPRPAGVVADAVRADQLGTCVSLALDDPSALRQLQDAAAELRDAPHLALVLVRVVRTAMALAGADFGNVQVVDLSDGSLVLVTQCGFGPGFLDHFAVVQGEHCVCGRAARQGAQAVVADVLAAPDMAPHEGIFRTAGVRAVQSTPLVDCVGRLVGVVSTHMSEPGQPSEHSLRIMRLYGLLAGESIGRWLRGPSADGVPPGLRHDATPLARCVPDQALTDPLMSRILSDTINRIFSAGLSLAGALPRITDDFAAQRVRAGIEELDGMIRSMQRAAVDLGVRGEHRESATGPTARRLRRGSGETDAPAHRA